ncbi:MAG: histidine phosphatase family protein [Planctomycetaceae bacterium]|nr:histidine phosphatase family protein [Planctomycetaceae bacterium]
MGDPSRTIWLCRHGNRRDFVDSQWRDAGRPFDSPLSDDGFEQARVLGRSFVGDQVDHLICSPFTRCLQTANEVAGLIDKPMHVEHGVGELYFDEWFELPPKFSEAAALGRDFPRINTAYQSVIRPQFPESEDDAWRRTSHAMQSLLGAFDGNLLIVAHGGSIWGMVRSLLGVDKPDIWVGLCCRIALVQDGRGWTMTDNGLESADRSAARWV